MVARIMILAGGTGGHIYPALAVARELRALDCEVTWMGTKAGMEANLVPAAGIPIEWLTVSGFRGKGLPAKLLAPFKLVLACLQAWAILRRNKPGVVLGMGGFVTAPGGLMARLLGIPLVIHEQNRIPGTTNRLLVKWAKVILEAFPGSFPPSLGARCVGNPLRREIVEAVSEKRLGPGKTVKILVVGGSQGAMALNRCVPEALSLAGLQVDVLHQTGEAMCEETEAMYQRFGIVACVVAFIDDMAAAYRWADLAICRAGAMTISELTAAGLPAVLIPYPYAIDDHQTANARFLADAGAALLMPQSSMTPESLAQALTKLAEDSARIREMSQRARSLARLDAAHVVAKICLSEVGA